MGAFCSTRNTCIRCTPPFGTCLYRMVERWSRVNVAALHDRTHRLPTYITVLSASQAVRSLQCMYFERQNLAYLKRLSARSPALTSICPRICKRNDAIILWPAYRAARPAPLCLVQSTSPLLSTSLPQLNRNARRTHRLRKHFFAFKLTQHCLNSA